MDIVEDWEKHRALEAIMEELPTLLEVNEEGYSPVASVHLRDVERALAHCLARIEARNE